MVNAVDGLYIAVKIDIEKHLKNINTLKKKWFQTIMEWFQVIQWKKGVTISKPEYDERLPFNFVSDRDFLKREMIGETKQSVAFTTIPTVGQEL